MTRKTRILYIIANWIDGMPAEYFDFFAPLFERIMRRKFNSMLMPEIGT